MESMDSLCGRYLTFKTDQQLFGLPIADVVQIIGMQKITPVPDFPSYAKGVIHLRGEVIPVIDVRLRFQRTETVYQDRTCIIVVSIEKALVGFIVDEVDEVTDISQEDICIPPRMASDLKNGYLTGIGKLQGKIVLLLDTAKILSECEFESLQIEQRG
jgi:purine-binding chemotaxis protein CheW